MHGFTIVEILITITVMGILMTLAVVGINSSQVKARDDARKADIEAISAALESYYTTGTDDSDSYGTYPTTQMNDETAIRENLRDVNFDSFIAPNQDTIDDTFIAATNATQTTSGVTPQPTVSQYVYQPLTATNLLCDGSDYNGDDKSDECRKYNLYYRTETNNTVYQVMSKNR